jgi:hypothetical protein
MEIVKVYSPVDDKEIRNNLNNSPVWKQAYHTDDLPVARKKHATLFEYSVKFDGLKPIQVTNIKTLEKR